jgi:hypothetical protein
MAATATADRSNDFSPDIGVNIDRTIADGWSLRAEAGRVRWRFDGNPSLRTIPASETLTLTRLSLTAIAGLPHRHPSGAGRPYVGAGVGYYHYGLERNALTAPNQLGVQLVGGVEILPPRSRFSVRVEAQLQLVGGPNAPPDNPAVVPAPRSHFVSDQVLNLRMGVGVSRRF